MVGPLETPKACIHHTDISVVDYMIASDNLLTLFLYFNVGLNFPRLSDHSKLSYRIMANYCSEPGMEKLFEPPHNYKWSSISVSAFQDALCTKHIHYENTPIQIY